MDHHFALVTMLQRGLAEAGEAGVLRRFVAWGEALTHADACHEQAQYEMATFHPNTTLKDGGAIVNSRTGEVAKDRLSNFQARDKRSLPRPGDRLVITHPVTGKVATTTSVFAADAASLSVATTVGLTDAGHRLEGADVRALNSASNSVLGAHLTAIDLRAGGGRGATPAVRRLAMAFAQLPADLLPTEGAGLGLGASQLALPPPPPPPPPPEALVALRLARPPLSQGPPVVQLNEYQSAAVAAVTLRRFMPPRLIPRRPALRGALPCADAASLPGVSSPSFSPSHSGVNSSG